jgi:hypothetical protein
MNGFENKQFTVQRLYTMHKPETQEGVRAERFQQR